MCHYLSPCSVCPSQSKWIYILLETEIFIHVNLLNNDEVFWEGSVNKTLIKNCYLAGNLLKVIHFLEDFFSTSRTTKMDSTQSESATDSVRIGKSGDSTLYLKMFPAILNIMIDYSSNLIQAVLEKWLHHACLSAPPSTNPGLTHCNFWFFTKLKCHWKWGDIRPWTRLSNCTVNWWHS